MMTTNSRYLSPAKKAWITRKVREEILKGKSKSQVAKEFNLSYKQVLKRTKDIKLKRGLPQELREKIRQEVLDGKSKRRVSIELGVSEKTVQYYTGDLLLTPFRKIQTPDRTLELVKALLADGYALASGKYGSNEYRKLRQHCPSISKIRMNEKTIFFLKGKEEDAARVFLEHQQKKIISYHDLKAVTKVFRVDLSKREKQTFLLKNKQRKLFRNKRVLKEGSLRENDDSFSFFYVRRYCLIAAAKVVY